MDIYRILLTLYIKQTWSLLDDQSFVNAYSIRITTIFFYLYFKVRSKRMQYIQFVNNYSSLIVNDTDEFLLCLLSNHEYWNYLTFLFHVLLYYTTSKKLFFQRYTNWLINFATTTQMYINKTEKFSLSSFNSSHFQNIYIRYMLKSWFKEPIIVWYSTQYIFG